MTQRKSALPAGTEESANEKICQLHIITYRPVCQTLRGAVAGAALLGMLGIIGGTEQETIRFWPGMFWAAGMLILLDWGSKPWQR